MNNKFKNGSKVFVYGPGQNNGKYYKNKPAIILERDSFFYDYHVKFNDGTEDWILPKYLRKPYARKKGYKRKWKLII